MTHRALTFPHEKFLSNVVPTKIKLHSNKLTVKILTNLTWYITQYSVFFYLAKGFQNYTIQISK